MLAAPKLPVPSMAITLMEFCPDNRVIGPKFQFAIPVAIPLPPRSLVQVIWVTPILSCVFPAKDKLASFVMNVSSVVGLVIVIVGFSVSVGV